jgi:hypothetical protein
MQLKSTATILHFTVAPWHQVRGIHDSTGIGHNHLQVAQEGPGQFWMVQKYYIRIGKKKINSSKFKDEAQGY